MQRRKRKAGKNSYVMKTEADKLPKNVFGKKRVTTGKKRAWSLEEAYNVFDCSDVDFFAA